MKEKIIDLRSDTVTRPTKAMFDSILTAELGDDVYEDDPTVKALEHRSAEILGMEAALLVPTGTFGNQLAIFTHCQRGGEVILGEDSHIIIHEAAAAAVIAGVQLRTIAFPGFMPVPSEIKKRIRTHKEIHEPVTALICLENALANGRVVPISIMREIYENAKNRGLERGVPVHLDGARIFNAAAALGVDVSEIAKYTDSVMFCLSKGLCAPVGSILAGSRAFIEEARVKRKLMGGGMRQAGVLAAPGLIAVNEMPKRLRVDHENAELLGRLLSEIDGIEVAGDIEINMVFFKSASGKDLKAELAKRGIIVNPREADGSYRFVTHNDVAEEDLRRVAGEVRAVM